MAIVPSVVIIDRFQMVALALSQSLERRDGFEIAGVFYDDAPCTAVAAADLCPELVLVEMSTGGPGLIHRLRELLPDTKIFATTGRRTPDEERAARLAGADRYLEKDHASGDLVEAVRQAFG